MLRKNFDVLIAISIIVMTVVLANGLRPPIMIPSGFGGAQLIFLLLLPVGAGLAARWWFHPAVFLTFGLLGVASFLPAFLNDSELGRRYNSGSSSEFSDMLRWLGRLVGGGLVCRWVGFAARRR